MAPIDHAAAKAEKKAKKEKKRAREEDAAADTERKHKKSKSVAAVEAPEASSDLKAEKKKKKSKKDKHTEDAVAQEETKAPAVEDKSEKKHKKKKHHDAEVAVTEEVDTPVAADSEKKKKKSKKNHKETEAIEIAERPKKSKKDETAAEPEENASPADADAMEIDMPPPAKPSKSNSNIYQPPDIPANPQFPFFTQTVSLYEPLFPIGWAQPVTNCQQQHLSHLRNKYVPSLRGVLLDYKNVAFGENPGRKGAATDDESPATVMAKGESAVGFGWITADVDLFVPSRGAWMEAVLTCRLRDTLALFALASSTLQLKLVDFLPTGSGFPTNPPRPKALRRPLQSSPPTITAWFVKSTAPVSGPTPRRQSLRARFASGYVTSTSAPVVRPAISAWRAQC
ncbi:hypothetical protein FOXG_13744 [Fusarium oxysporum f. sp. lycopersici 4287]|uniref:Uncharacterized protein n=2 Tax=Fusarium oxysporum TaxID=5507 RepID=A0A0J9VWQ0_FUSO4|nr:hypothetical protein FOXG_13744 [Fusarium oxysporum f. sp. lycopersici 4287]KNB15015.1 hypothetical protein FOXG_13744 [Fusarium oxysporum f. sp. lycopersici 4287]